MTFVDTSGLVALFNARDGHHAAARAAWKRTLSGGTALILTDWIVAETVTLLRRRAGFEAARRVGARLLEGAVAEVVFVDAALLAAGWEIFLRYSDHQLSLTDCVSFALMRRRRVRRAFTFDADFAACGFETA